MADKNIMDYAHLYLNGNVILNKYHRRFSMNGWLTGKVYQFGACKLFEFEEEGYTDFSLVLRRLEDMTEEEAKYIVDNTLLKQTTMGKTEKDFAIALAERWVANSSIFVYLLSRSFDLFGLIDAGLAIDAKTIQP